MFREYSYEPEPLQEQREEGTVATSSLFSLKKNYLNIFWEIKEKEDEKEVKEEEEEKLRRKRLTFPHRKS